MLRLKVRLLQDSSFTLFFLPSSLTRKIEPKTPGFSVHLSPALNLIL